MGSYCSILNNTEDVWCVKLGPDEAAINIAAVACTAVGIAAAALSTAGAAAPLAASLAANGVVEVFGVSTAALAAGTAAAAGAGSAAAGFAGASTVGGAVIAFAGYVRDEVTKELGLDRLSPGEKKRYGKMSLSLWQQGTCFRTRVNPDNDKEIVVEKLYMRPIFSGPTDDSENVHEIQYWINKFGVEHVNTLHLN